MRFSTSFVRRAIGFFAVVAVATSFSSVHALVQKLTVETQGAGVATNLGIYGGDNWDIAVDGDHVYTIASGVPNGFFYSTDAGVTWQRPAGSNDYGSGQAVEVDTATHAVYVSLGGDLYKSTDYGATLTKIASGSGFALLFAQSKILYANGNTVYMSSDGGTTFTGTIVSSSANVTDLAASPTAGTFYAVNKDSASPNTLLEVTSDSGAFWGALSISASGITSFSHVAVNPNDAHVITLSDDNNLWLTTNGSTWVKQGVSPARSCADFSFWTSTKWYACAGYSTDNGATWTDMDMHTNVMRGPGKVVVMNSADESVLYGDCMSGVCKSTNGGLTWTNSFDGITGVNVLAISQTTNKGTVWISSSNGLGKSTNFTSATPTWTWPILPCDPDSRCDSSGIGEAVWVKPNDANIVLAGSIGGYIYRSTDAGTTWTAAIPSVINVDKFKDSGTNILRPKFFTNDPTDASTVYLAMYGSSGSDYKGTVLKSTDAGVTWTDLALTSDAPTTTLAVTATGTLYAGTGYGTSALKGLYSYDGSSWTKLSGIDERLNVNSVVVDPEVRTTVYATASADLAPVQADGFYKSTNAGSTWTKIVPTGYTNFGAITVQRSTSPNTLYMSAVDASNHGALLKSSDQGATWGTLYTGLKAESFTTVLFDGLVAGNKHGVFSLKSKGKFTSKQSAKSVAKNKPVVISTTLKDSATKKILKGRTVDLYRKQGNVWRKYKSAKTNTKGYAAFTVRSISNKQYRITWTPGKGDAAEYAAATSATFSVTMQ